MLIDFTVENFRSIKEPVTLSMVAQSRATGKASNRAGVKPDDEIAKPCAIGNRNIEVLPAAGIFGPNASGKSNIIKALDYFFRWISFGTSWTRRTISFVVPFRLDPATEARPTTFEMRVSIEHVVYSYKISSNGADIVFEQLDKIFAEPKGKSLVYSRRWEGGEYVWKNGKDFRGALIQIEKSLQRHEPFLSVLTWRITHPATLPLTNWLVNAVTTGSIVSDDANQRDWALHANIAYDNLLTRVSKVIQQFDVGVSGINVNLSEREDNSGRLQHYSQHIVNGKVVEWPFEEESNGTQRLFWLISRMLRSFDVGIPLLIDDFGSSLHPDITHAVVRMFQDDKTNPKRAQLIFNSHDYTLMHGNLLRRDQIWFTQKRKDGSTELYPLTDFQPRNDLAIDKAYINGRFGAVPILPADEDLLPTEELVG